MKKRCTLRRPAQNPVMTANILTISSALCVFLLAATANPINAKAADLGGPLDEAATEQAQGNKRPALFGIPLGGAKFPKRYVPPLTNPVFNETPFITSEVRLIHLYHNIPDEFPDPLLGGGGGNINVVAAQARLKLTDRLGLIATKDGYAFANFDSPLLTNEDGFVNIAAGAKYALFHNKATDSILTAGLRFEIPVQELSTLGGAVEFQGAGSGFVNPFLTGATTLENGIQLQASIGANIAFDQDAETSILHYSLHANYELFENFFPLIELNGFTAIDGGERFTSGALANFAGADLANFGSSDRGTTVTVGGGFRYRFNDNVIFGTGAEVAVTDNDSDLFGWRVTSDLSFNF